MKTPRDLRPNCVRMLLSGFLMLLLSHAVPAEAVGLCDQRTSELKIAEARYTETLQDLNRAAVTCKDDYSCIHGYQEAYSTAKTNLNVAQANYHQACP